MLQSAEGGQPRALLRIPPFPGAKVGAFHEPPGSIPAAADEVQRCIDLMRQHRVGGSFWAEQPNLPVRYLLVRPVSALRSSRALATGSSEPLLWSEPAGKADEHAGITGECDPWHMLSGATALVAEAEDEVAAIAAMLGVPIQLFDPVAGTLSPAPKGKLGLRLPSSTVVDPFSGKPISLGQAIELCGFWRRLIDANRDLAGGIGFAFWKRRTVAPLLWSGVDEFPFYRELPAELRRQAIAVWRSKAPPRVIRDVERRNLVMVEVEDGFLRSSGLGSDCVPPLSITVDRRGAHFDPGQPSDLECLLQSGDFNNALVERARQLRATIVAAGLGKYERGTVQLPRPGRARRHILVPGQVEDDRSVMTGGCGLRSNLELLRRVRALEMDAFILYKPHPDVLAGHRSGDVPPQAALQYADMIAAEQPISALLDMVDAVHVNTSLTGFEALMRGKAVTTHGVPFYAGWGLTSDLGPVPPRRTARRTVDELVAATLLLYPRYFDPVSGLPCPAETMVQRLCATVESTAGVLPAIRRLQGRLKSSLRAFVR
ncbi:capsule biosynthesis protein [uncultured Sphingomonas sp.]|uniref:capsular polysaccharide export protein, LipB/KpsS family n=1 Tax=uncultured Sphingomonas sp. TaxID=158754 RepID=UPI0025E0DACA|nr:capsule biosynthesis protein [uncultured Sphingomonas sp.]